MVAAVSRRRSVVAAWEDHPPSGRGIPASSVDGSSYLQRLCRAPAR